MSNPPASIGVDIVEIHRIREAVERWQDRFLKRVYTGAELQYCGQRWSSLAARFAAKEAVMKALRTGDGIGWHDIEVLQNEDNAPYVRLHGHAGSKAEQLGIKSFSLSLSHSEKYAVAVTITNA